MPVFFITTPMVHNGRFFQYSFETNEVRTVQELMDVLEDGRSVTGLKFNAKDPTKKTTPIAVRLAMIGQAEEIAPDAASCPAKLG